MRGLKGVANSLHPPQAALIADAPVPSFLWQRLLLKLGFYAERVEVQEERKLLLQIDII